MKQVAMFYTIPLLWVLKCNYTVYTLGRIYMNASTKYNAKYHSKIAISAK